MLGCQGRAFLCREGLARFAVDEYVKPSRENIRNVHMVRASFHISCLASHASHVSHASRTSHASRWQHDSCTLSVTILPLWRSHLIRKHLATISGLIGIRCLIWQHLTNYSLNKKAEGFRHSDAADGGDDGSKRTASSVFAALAAAGVVGDVEALWGEIGKLVSRTLAVLQVGGRAAQRDAPLVPGQRSDAAVGRG